jgi:hypothetical protein
LFVCVGEWVLRHARTSSWVEFMKEVDTMSAGTEKKESGSVVVSALQGEMHGHETQHCFKIRVGGVRVELDASVSGASHAELHSFTVSKVESVVRQEVLASPALQHAVEELVGSFNEPSVTGADVQAALRSAIATEVGKGVQVTMEKELCASLSEVVCPECAHEKHEAWEAKCMA